MVEKHEPFRLTDLYEWFEKLIQIKCKINNDGFKK
jgi:hypothetical protein